MKKSFTKTVNECKKEVDQEFTKKIDQLMVDTVREANSEYSPAKEALNLDIIKHLIKRLDLHTLYVAKKTDRTNCLVIVLAVISAIGAVFTVLDFFCK